MRYHKAIAITRAEADLLVKRPSRSLNACVVIQHIDDWYDVRKMTEKELDYFVQDLVRAHFAAHPEFIH